MIYGVFLNCSLGSSIRYPAKVFAGFSKFLQEAAVSRLSSQQEAPGRRRALITVTSSCTHTFEVLLVVFI